MENLGGFFTLFDLTGFINHSSVNRTQCGNRFLHYRLPHSIFILRAIADKLLKPLSIHSKASCHGFDTLALARLCKERLPVFIPCTPIRCLMTTLSKRIIMKIIPPESLRLCQKAKIAGFTLIELLTVIAVIGVLITLSFAVISKARKQANATVCLSNIRQVGIAVSSYIADVGTAPVVDQGTWGWGTALDDASKKSYQTELIDSGYCTYDAFFCRVVTDIHPTVSNPQRHGNPSNVSPYSLMFVGADAQNIFSIGAENATDSTHARYLRPGSVPLVREYASVHDGHVHAYFCDGSVRAMLNTKKSWAGVNFRVTPTHSVVEYFRP